MRRRGARPGSRGQTWDTSQFPHVQKWKVRETESVLLHEIRDWDAAASSAPVTVIYMRAAKQSPFAESKILSFVPETHGTPSPLPHPSQDLRWARLSPPLPAVDVIIFELQSTPPSSKGRGRESSLPPARTELVTGFPESDGPPAC